MKRPALGGLSAASVLVAAIVAGMAGGAIAVGAAQGSDPAPVPPAVTTMHQVADEAAPAPATAPVAGVDESAAGPPVVVQSEKSTPAGPGPDAASAPKVVVAEGESAQDAADRAADEADRAEEAADRAEDTAPQAPVPTSAAEAPTPPAVEAPTAEPAPKPDCEVGGPTMSNPRTDGYQVTLTCVAGKWVETSRVYTPKDRSLSPAPTSPAQEAAMVAKRKADIEEQNRRNQEECRVDPNCFADGEPITLGPPQ